MGSHGGDGNKFVSVNLNKSFGQSAYNHNHSPHYNGSYGTAGSVRPSSHGGGGKRGGDGMVVLSRPRSSQKAAPKLSVPPPLNLPSLRKEHKKFDLSGPGSGSAGGAGSGSGLRPNVSGIGWTKPGAIALQENNGNGDALVAEGLDQSVRATDGVVKGSSSYVPPSARLAGVGLSVTATSQSRMPAAEKAMVLRGEDFPSLKAALPATSGPVHKPRDNSQQKLKQGVSEESSNEQKDNYHLNSTHPMRRDNSQQKLKQGVSEESSNEQRDNYHLNSTHHMRPQGQHAYSTISNGFNANGNQGRRFGSSHMADKARKQEDYPLPLVRLNPRSDWADDERDTGHGFADRARDHGLTKSEAYWDRDFDFPRTTILPQKPLNNSFERWGQRGDETGKGPSCEVLKVDPYSTDVRIPSQEGNNWRTYPLQRDRFNVQEVVNDRNASSQSIGINRDTGRENKYIPQHFGDGHRDGGVTGNGESALGRRDMGHGQEGRQHWNHMVEFSNPVSEQRDRFGAEQSSRYRHDNLQNRTISKSSFSSGGKRLPVNDLNFNREKLPLPKSDRPYLEDPLLKDFGSTGYDERDPFSGGLVGVIKRKKDVVKQADFHDPVRESFEAELERVQKLQEMERQRIIEEQERVLEQVRREEEERRRLIREEEEQRRRLEEEAREAAWRAEQERLEVIRRAEEQKIAREEEKRRILIEEERRKQAAKQKLLELEAKIAQRGAEAEKGDNSVAAFANEKDVFGAEYLDDWEDSERMVERITTSASSDSSALNRPFVTSSRFPPSEKSSSGYLERRKTVNSWRDEYENENSSLFALQDQDNGHQSYRRDASVGGRAFPRKEFYGGAGHITSSTYPKGGLQESHIGEYAHPKEHRWSPSVDVDPFNKNRGIGLESYENISERYSDAEWGQSQTRGNPHSPFPERLYPNSEADTLYSYGRSRYSMRQPRVLPPPSIASLHKTSFRGEIEPPDPLTSLGNDKQYNYVPRSESAMLTEYYDELDESADSAAMLASAEEKDISLSGNDSIILNKSEKDIMMTVSSSISDGEDEDWTLEKNDEMQQQEEYDEDGYQEDEVHEVDDENIDLTHEFEVMNLEEQGSSHMMDNLVLGFDEGVEVGLPSDESERNPRSDGNNLEIPKVSVGIVEDQGSVDGTIGDQEILHPVDRLPQATSKSASWRINETEKNIQESVSQPINAPPTSLASNVSNISIGSSGFGLSIQHKVPSSVDMALSHSSSGQPINSAGSSAPNQADLPVKLQFGLFTGPSLIPSPVPAIQIGSIQMPLHLHLPVDPSITHLESPQPPLFQFGQLRYTSPSSQGILPLAPQSMSFVQPSIQHHFNLNQNSGVSLPISEDTHTHNLMNDDVSSLPINNQPAVVSRALNLSDDNSSRVLNSVSVSGTADTSALVQKTGTDFPHAVDNQHMLESVLQTGDKEHHDSVVNFGQSDEKGPEVQLRSAAAVPQFISCEKDFNVPKGQGSLSGNKAKRLPYSVRNYGLRSSYTTPEAPRSDSSGFQRRPRRSIQRTEFRIRQSSGLVPNKNNSRFDNNSNLNGEGMVSTSSGFKRGNMTTKPLKQVVESESPVNFQEIDSESKVAKRFAKEGLPSSQGIPFSRKGNMKRNISEQDVDTPSQSGVVHVFKQSGIEAPSDEDDFIEVRSKRQMLNDRREQREKEIKARSRVTKPPRKPSSSAQSTVVSTSSNKISASLGREASHYTRSSFLVSEGKGMVNKKVTTGFTSKASQQLAPIGTPAVTADIQAEIRSHAKSLQTGSVPVVSGAGKEIGPGLISEAKDKVLDTVQTPLGPWGNARISQQVMALTQTQLDEAMNPAHFETHVAPIGGHTTLVSEPMLASSSILMKDKPMSSSASPINSLLAGERIQFGAVTSPTVLPPSGSHVVSLGIGAPGLFRPDIQKWHNISNPESNLFSGKDKCPEESCSYLQDCEDEAEAEAAASAVAVAAISSDKIVGNGLSSVSISDAKKFQGPDVHGIAGVAGDHQSGTQSRAEESPSVSLPADLSVETLPISLWPPLPSPHNPSSQMISHFPGTPLHFPFYEMNPMLGGPIFAFSPHEESSGTQSQSQKSTVSGLGHLGTWQQCHPTMDSFYGPLPGFTGPFISPPGGIPGVQAPPHMLVYNHYARVGQFGQVGLSFMGTTYIPSGKQLDWKHNPTSSGLEISEGEMTNMNMVSAQHNPPNLPAQMPHLGPGSPLLPLASPFGMFDVSPFQSAPPDMSVQGHWPHVPASQFHSVPHSLPLQQQAEGVLPSQFSHQHPIEQSLIGNRLAESRLTAPSDSDSTFPMVMDAGLTQFPDELGLVNSSSCTTGGPSTQSAVNQSSNKGAIANTGKDDAAQNGNGPSMNSFKPRHLQQKNLSSQQFNHLTGYRHKRGGASQKSSSASEWSHRRTGFHGRSHSNSTNAEKNFPNSKLRQIYVAKQTEW